MLLSIEEDTLERLKCLTQFPNEVIEDFCRVSIEGIFKPISHKIISSAAARLSTDEDVVRKGVQALTKVFLNAAKMRLSQEDVNLSFKVLGFSEDLCSIMGAGYEGGREEMRGLLMLRSPPYRTYKDLQWRLDVKVASRSLYDQCQPSFLLKLHTTKPDNTLNDNHQNRSDKINASEKNMTDSDKNYTDNTHKNTDNNPKSNMAFDEDDISCVKESFVFECSVATLAHIRQSLEGAVKEGGKGRNRRVIEHL